MRTGLRPGAAKRSSSFSNNRRLAVVAAALIQRPPGKPSSGPIQPQTPLPRAITRGQAAQALN
eukprot:12266967-Alexandrium_andersonii.AAC.1